MSVQGLPELLNKFKELGFEGARVSQANISAVADLIVSDAKQRAPAAFGKIRQGISKETRVLNDGQFIAYIFATAPESAFQEFGTGGKVYVPDEMADIASQFQGQSGAGMQAFIQSLIDWIKLRGLTNLYDIRTRNIKTHAGKISRRGTADENEQLAWAIAKKILRDGLAPQPFLYPAFVSQSAKLIPMLKQALQEMLANNQG